MGLTRSASSDHGRSGGFRGRRPHSPLLPSASHQSVEREPARAEDKHHQGSDQERKRSSRGELVGVGEDREQGLSIRRNIGDDHVDDQGQRNEARAEPEEEKQATSELKRRDKIGVEYGRGYAKRGKEVYDLTDISQLSPAGLHELPSPIQPYGEQERRCKARGRTIQQAIALLEVFDHLVTLSFLTLAGGHNQPSSAHAGNHVSSSRRCSSSDAALFSNPH